MTTAGAARWQAYWVNAELILTRWNDGVGMLRTVARESSLWRPLIESDELIVYRQKGEKGRPEWPLFWIFVKET